MYTRVAYVYVCTLWAMQRTVLIGSGSGKQPAVLRPFRVKIWVEEKNKGDSDEVSGGYEVACGFSGQPLNQNPASGLEVTDSSWITVSHFL